jgi:hypothetical protein
MVKTIGNFGSRIVFILCIVVIVALAAGIGAPASADIKQLACSASFISQIATDTQVSAGPPIVTTIRPNSGTTSGGTYVTIKGAGYTGNIEVMFGSNPAQIAPIYPCSDIVNNARQIVVISPAGSTGTVDVTVTTRTGTSAISPADRFTYFIPKPPTITGFSPDSGPYTGGTLVTITGDSFTGTTGVIFGTIPASSFKVTSDTSITATSPVEPIGNVVQITVKTPNGTYVTSSAEKFTFLPGSPSQKSWQPLGSPGFSAGNTQDESLFVYNGTPYVAYTDYTYPSADNPNTGKATVMMYTGTVWQPVGNPGFSAGAAYQESLVVHDGTPYVAYSDGANDGKATVMMYTGTVWQPVGNPGFSDGGAWYESLFVYEGTPYVAYADDTKSRKATVMKFTGGSWEPVGNPGFSGGISEGGISLFIDDGTLYVAYTDDDTFYRKATVMKFTGGSWEPVGNPGFSDGQAEYVSLSVYNGVPYVAYQDWANGLRTTVMKYTDNSWKPVGHPGISNQANEQSIFIDKGIPYVAYTDRNYDWRATVQKYIGNSWHLVGSPGFSDIATYGYGPGDLSIKVDNGIPYVAYRDYAHDHKATVMAYFKNALLIPVVTTINPNSGPTVGGTIVTITGDRFTGATEVMFGTIPASSFTVYNDTSIAATSPSEPLGTVDVIVTTNKGASAISSRDKFTYTNGVPEFPSLVVPAIIDILLLGVVMYKGKKISH